MKNWDIAEETMKHEYGHSVHFSQIGLPAYVATVVIPSVIDHSYIGYDEYYSQPWEYIADELGGVNTRTNNFGQPYQYFSNAGTMGSLYWLFTIFLPGGMK